jgi:zinc protease
VTENFESPRDVQRVDGFDVPAFWLPHEGPATAGLLVRSGRGAEPLALSGITHIASHLIANEIGLDPHGPGAYQDLDVLGYSFTGDPEHIRAYLSTWGSMLSAPPVEELAYAIQQCTDERPTAEVGSAEQLLRLRHGATGPGALSFDEFALRKAGHKQVHGWSSRHMHSSNAALWFSGPLLEGLRLRLMNGVPVRTQAPLSQIPTPGAAYGTKGEVGFSFLVPRSHAFEACIDIAERRARHELINRRGACTRIEFDVRRHGTENLELLVVADALNGRDNEVLLTLLWVFDHLAATPPTPEEVDEYRNAVAGLFFQPEYFAARARDAAVQFLVGAPLDTWSRTYEELDALTPEAVSEAARRALGTTLAVASRDCELLTERFAYVGSWVPTLAQGAFFKPVLLPGEKSAQRELVVGKAGLTLREGDHLASVFFSECALLIRSDDGYRELISENGSRAVIIANAWEKSAYLLDIIDSQCLPENTLVLDEKFDRRGGYVSAERRRWNR